MDSELGLNGLKVWIELLGDSSCLKFFCLCCKLLFSIVLPYGKMAEWFIATVLKIVECESVPRVRIPFFPPLFSCTLFMFLPL